MSNHLSPFVFWAQKYHAILLKVALIDCENTEIRFEENTMFFKAKGTGAHGFNVYEFQLSLYADIIPKCTISTKTGYHINVEVPKATEAWWPRLTADNAKAPWLKLDHDRFESDEINDDTDETNEMFAGEESTIPDGNFEPLLSAQADGRPTHEQRRLPSRLFWKTLRYRLLRIYLAVYNIFMFVGFSRIFVETVMLWQDGHQKAYYGVKDLLKLVQLTQYVEVVHPLFNINSGSVLMPFLQITGRCIILFAMVDQEPRIQIMPVTIYMLLVWSAIEVIRYLYYLTQVMKIQFGLLAWLRYTAWTVLYPCGFICEAVIVFRNLIFIDHSKKWSLHVPLMDTRIHFSSVLRIYLLFVMSPAMYLLMRHMYRVRKRKLGPHSKHSKRN